MKKLVGFLVGFMIIIGFVTTASAATCSICSNPCVTSCSKALYRYSAYSECERLDYCNYREVYYYNQHRCSLGHLTRSGNHLHTTEHVYCGFSTRHCY